MSCEGRLRALLAKELAIPEERLTLQATLEELEVDSLRMIELAFAIEESFGVQMAEDAAQLMARIRTFGDLCSYVDELLASRARTGLP
jgi:acyl carrier protein